MLLGGGRHAAQARRGLEGAAGHGQHGQTVEGAHGSLELGPDYWLRTTTAAGTHAQRHPPPRYAWADPAYDLVQASIVPCHADLLRALQGRHAAETTGADNLKTMQLVFACYDAARDERIIKLNKLELNKLEEQA